MATQESFRERQVQELEAIISIFGNDVEDLRNSISTSKPPDIRIKLTPLRDSSNGITEAYVSTILRITCPNKYPKIVPKITLEESKGISDQLIEELSNQLQQQAQTLRGEVMIFELTQTVQTFLFKHNKPPRGSFYEEMLQEKQKREQELLDIKIERETRERQTLMEEVERRKEIFKTEAKRRDSARRSISESNKPHSSSESSENSSPYYRGHMYPNKCLDHRNSEILYFHKVGRQIRRGCCLGHSQRGCIAYTGIDKDSGQLLYITEWSIKYSQLEPSCGGGGGKCFWNTNEHKCSGGHRADDVIASIEKQVATLSQLRHKNLVQYECVLCKKSKEGIIVHLVQDFVLGTSVYCVSSTLGWCMDGSRMVARGVIEALVYLHNKGVSHSHLLDSTVFMDNIGNIRCTDFSLVPFLLELIDGNGQRSSKGDLPALGVLVESLMTATRTFEMQDFIEKCHSDRTLSASELLEHPFLRTNLFTTEDKETFALTAQGRRRTETLPSNIDFVPLLSKNNALTKNANVFTIPSLPTSQSRLRTEFQVLTYLGKGAFGDVLKVRNILDNREYAIKRIPLPGRSRQLYKKMTREVELLSRLNHENVVRYFNSWIELVNDDDIEDMEIFPASDFSASQETSRKTAKSPHGAKPLSSEETEESLSDMWTGYIPNMDDSDSDGIEFVDSNGEVAIYNNDEQISEEELIEKSHSPKPPLQVMYIQMEFCEKCTLRTAIDDGLYQDSDRLWRLFREIVEGLSHIHQQGIIHRDLKPVNIFLDSHDQIKIGDFGLATTSFLALQCQAEIVQHSYTISTEDNTGTGKVGTTLYVAPELTGNASKSTYSQKVDMYTVGIILFEMCQPPFDTSMERVQTILQLRSTAVDIPNNLLVDSKYEKIVKLLRWLLNHDPNQRPTAEELLISDLIPPVQLEANELQEMLRHALANPQSKAYKHLVARCLQQECDEVLEHTYHLGSNRLMKTWSTPLTLDGFVTLHPLMDYVKERVVCLFRRHGAVEVDGPLLSPLTKNTNLWHNPVKLMTHSGSVVVLPTDLRTQFARLVAMSGVNMLRRYCVQRVYREEKVFNFHPRQQYECAFDVITPNTGGGQLIDAELLSLAHEITREIPNIREKNLIIRLNHTNLLKAILQYCNVPKAMYNNLFISVSDYIEGRLSKFQFHASVNTIMEKSKNSANSLIDLLLADFLLTGTTSNIDDSSLRFLLRGKNETSSLAKGALREIETIVGLAHSLGVTCPIHICPGLTFSFERNSSGGIVWQMLADLKPTRSARPAVLAMGERYDGALLEYQKQASSFHSVVPCRGISGSGLSFSLEKLVAAFGADNGVQETKTIDVGICVTGSRPPLKDVTYIMRLLWSAGIRCTILETLGSGGDDAQDLAKLGASHVILISEKGALRVRSWDRERFTERHITRSELVDFVQKTLKPEVLHNNHHDYHREMSNSNHLGLTNNFGNSFLTSNVKSSYGTSGLGQLPNIQVVFMMQDKLTANFRKRYENQVTHQMTSTFLQFAKKETLIVLVIELPKTVVNAIVGAINPRDIPKKETEQEINNVIDRFSKHRRYIGEIYDEILDYLSDSKSHIIALYSISDSYYRIII